MEKFKMWLLLAPIAIVFCVGCAGNAETHSGAGTGTGGAAESAGTGDNTSGAGTGTGGTKQ